MELGDQLRQLQIAQNPYMEGPPELYFNKSTRQKNRLSFFLEIVDSNGNYRAIPYPPLWKGDEPTTLQGATALIQSVVLTINPSTLSNNMSKIVNRSQTMTGWLEEHWGDELDTITFAGSTAAFVVGAESLRDAGKLAPKINFNSQFLYQDTVNAGNNQTALGLTTGNRRTSVSYQELKKVLNLMSTNGCVFDEQGFVQKKYFIRLTYDFHSYLGFIESLDISEDASSPYKFTYTITYRAENTLYAFGANKLNG